MVESSHATGTLKHWPGTNLVYRPHPPVKSFSVESAAKLSPQRDLHSVVHHKALHHHPKSQKSCQITDGPCQSLLPPQSGTLLVKRTRPQASNNWRPDRLQEASPDTPALEPFKKLQALRMSITPSFNQTFTPKDFSAQSLNAGLL